MKINEMPKYIIEIDQALSEDMSKAIRLIIQQIDEETRTILVNKVEELLRTRTYAGANTDYLNGIREAIKIIKS